MLTVSEYSMAIKMLNCLCGTECRTKSWDLTLGQLLKWNITEVQVGAGWLEMVQKICLLPGKSAENTEVGGKEGEKILRRRQSKIPVDVEIEHF